MTTIELIPHLDAGDRHAWPGDQDERPLSELGWEQARAIAQALAAEPIAALFASPALRARQTLEPLAALLGLPIETLPALAERGEYETERRLGDRGEAALQELARRHPGGRVAAASHRDIIPIVIQRLAFEHGLRVEQFVGRGQWYSIDLGKDVRLALRGSPLHAG